MKFGTILADCPWHYRNGSDNGKRDGCADRHYGLQDDEWIVDLPVWEIAGPDSTLLLWATNPLMPLAFRVVEAWGFEHKTMATWVKMSRAAAPRLGVGYHLLGATEHLIIAQMAHARRPVKAIASVFFCPRGEHSAKPDYQYDIAEGYPGPYVELFHRPRGGMFGARPGWRFLGNEVDGLDMVEALRSLALEPDEATATLSPFLHAAPPAQLSLPTDPPLPRPGAREVAG